MYPYLIFLLIFFALPLTILGFLYWKEILKYRRTILWSLLFVYTIGWFWDWLSYKTGVWRYDSAETLGIWISGIPVEEFIGFYLLGTLFIVSVVIGVRAKFCRSKIALKT